MNKIFLLLAFLTASYAVPAFTPVQPAMAAAGMSKLGDLSAMRDIVKDTLALVEAGNREAAIQRITDYETAWDENASNLRKLDTETWRKLDDASDVALSSVRYLPATLDEMRKDLGGLIALLDDPAL